MKQPSDMCGSQGGQETLCLFFTKQLGPRGVTETMPSTPTAKVMCPPPSPRGLAWKPRGLGGKSPVLSEAPSSAAWGVLAGDRKTTSKRQKSPSTGQWILWEADFQNEAEDLVTGWQIHRTHKSSHQAALAKLRIPGTAVGTAHCHEPRAQCSRTFPVGNLKRAFEDVAHTSLRLCAYHFRYTKLIHSPVILLAV